VTTSFSAKALLHHGDGQESATEPWGFQIDVHHAIINYFVLGDQVVMAPYFAGSEPLVATSGKYKKYKGVSVLQEEQNQGPAMLLALYDAQRAKAILKSSKTQNHNLAEAFKANLVLNYAGAGVADSPAPQRKQLRELVDLYVGNTWFAWIGGSDATSVYYYRIHSPVILIEFDHQQPANLRPFAKDSSMPTRRHIHCAVRTPNGNDYDKDLLRQHYLAHLHA
jgi:hypothetical protein